MNYTHFGELLKDIRTSNNMTLEQLADGICSVRQLSRIESGENNPSLFLIHSFSSKLNINLQEYYRYNFSSGSFVAHNHKMKIEKLISESNLEELRDFILTIEDLPEFQSGENLQYIFYSKALCAAHLDKDNDSSIKYCQEGLRIINPQFNINNIKDQFYTGVSLTMINLIATNFIRLEQYEKSLPIMEDLFSILERHFFQVPFIMYRSMDFEKKLYQSTTYNLSMISMYLKQYSKALDYVEKGINFSKKYSYMRFLPELLYRKARLLLEMNRKEDAEDLFRDTLSFYKICRKEKDLKKLQEEIEDIIGKKAMD